jgi:Zn-dependent protease
VLSLQIGVAVKLSEPPPSPLDIVFWLFRTRVRINPGFWMMSLFLGWGYFGHSNLGMAAFGLWVLAVGVSILLHEFGHIFAGWAFGQKGEILLHSMGGLAIYSGESLARWQRIIISLAGPAIQLVLYAALYYGFGWPTRVDAGRFHWPFFLARMLEINLYWPILNLLPIWPLDGGQVVRQLCLYVTKYGTTVSLWLSLLTAGFLAYNALVGMGREAQLPDPAPWIPWPSVADLLRSVRSPYMAIMFGLFAVSALAELWGSGGEGQEEKPRKRQRHFDDPDW